MDKSLKIFIFSQCVILKHKQKVFYFGNLQFLHDGQNRSIQ